MNTADRREFALALSRLAERLSTCEQVNRYDTTVEKQAWTIAHDLLDLAESFRAYLDEHLPKLMDDNLSGDGLNNVLLDIGEEFRHIIYHVENSEFYAYLRNGPSIQLDTE